MKRKILNAILAMTLLLSMTLTANTIGAEASNQTRVILDGQTLTFEVPPQVIGGRTLVPMRKIFEELGAEVNWDGATQTITATKEETVIVLQIGNNSPTVNGRVVTIEQPGIVIDGRTLVPLRFVAEAFDIFVDWNAQTNTVTIGVIKATITMDDGGEIVLELYQNIAPQTVRNFVYLARQGFYDGLKFHRVIEGFMIQGGCPLSMGTGGPGHSIFGEFAANGFSNELRHTRGAISMARSQAYDSAGSQFFIVHRNAAHLDGEYAAFGRVVQGMDVVDRIALTPTSGLNGAVAAEDMPVIRSIRIDSNATLPEPDKLPR